MPTTLQLIIIIVQALLKILIISIVLISLGFLGMSLKILIVKNGKFPEFRVGHNKNMRKKGISCVKHEEIKCFKKMQKEGCGSCEGILKASA